jgi:DMSO/TMAO reductase YedYZ molybdopterin-dependent catalytic subunit
MMSAQPPFASQHRRQAVTRREFLQSALVGSVVARVQRSVPDGRLTGTLSLGGRGATDPPLDTLLGMGLDARRFYDLSALSQATLVTPADRFFVRTRRPDRLKAVDPWTIQIGGLVQKPVGVRMAELARDVEPMGEVLIECAGNNNPNNFGLMSAARWDGISMRRVLERVSPLPRATRVLVSGFDDHSQPARSSVPGAAWIFTFDDLDAAGAFLATGMNGATLTPDHGAPVRLIVPRWYGCACIKWVTEIILVDEDAPATTQMQEFAARTFQNGRPEKARDYKPATQDVAATAVRVEKWIVRGRPLYRVVGIVWGGTRPTNRLQIRFRPGEPWTAVESCPLPASTRTWSLWSHTWRPASPGAYQIALRVNEPGIRTNRLDLYFYVREVRIDEV